jgi:HAD superfamily hydrolase (TIGR01509 family)
VGHHLDAFYLDSDPGLSRAQLDEMAVEYRALYPQRRHAETSVYPGVVETLARLTGRKTTATTKNSQSSRAVLEQFGLAKHFDHIQGTDGFRYKPQPDVVLRAIAALKADPAGCLFVGDSETDMEAGRRAGVKTCAVRYGYGDPEAMRRWTPDYWIDDIRELLSQNPAAQR